MITIDLITGFLGSGKTTFLKRYADYFLRQGQHIGLLVNDYGAVNVDRMLLQELQGDYCDIETVAGACDADCHRRRFKTKLIAMGMSGYDRVLVEPSGLFDTDEFFDTLREAPLDDWYRIGAVLTIVEVGLSEELSEESVYWLASQASQAGTILLSKTQLVPPERTAAAEAYLRTVTETFCGRPLTCPVITRPWTELTDADFASIANSGFRQADFIKRYQGHSSYGSLYYMNQTLTSQQLRALAEALLTDAACGHVCRIKGYIREQDTWIACNADSYAVTLEPAEQGQNILLVIGESLQKPVIDRYFQAL